MKVTGGLSVLEGNSLFTENVEVDGSFQADGDVSLGNSVANDQITFTGTVQGTNFMVLDGSSTTGTTNKLTLKVTDPTGAKEITFPDTTGTVCVAGGTGLTLTETGSMSVDASQTQITSVGTIGTGTWQGTAVADTYVVDALTINGGTIDNSAIGGTTAAAGAFTTLGASSHVTLGDHATDDVHKITGKVHITGGLTVQTGGMKVTGGLSVLEGNSLFTENVEVDGSFQADGDVSLGNSVANDQITFTGTVQGTNFMVLDGSSTT